MKLVSLLRPKAKPELKTDLSVIVGLRNPGARYEGTRHNIGYEIVARVAGRAGVELGRAPSRVSAAVARVGSTERAAMLVAPFSYMNESGRVVRSALDYWKVPPGNLLIVHDDIDLAFARMRLQVGGGSGGNNGVRSVESHLGTREFSRLKIGVGRPPGSMDPADFVLKRFTRSEAPEVELIIEDGAEIVETWIVDRTRAQEMAAHRGKSG